MIELKNVSFCYSGQETGILEHVNLVINDGECVLLCGRSGCGKTTVTRLINGLIPNFYAGELNGEVKLDGQAIGDIPMYLLAERIGSVFQNPRTQFFNVDTDSEIAFGIENNALPVHELELRVNQATADLNIQNLRGRNIFELSGGEKQKIAFASVYAMNPDIYLLDEPSSNLDIDSIENLREHLELVKKKGKTIVIAEHRLSYLLDLADKIVYMENGQIERIMTRNEVRSLAPDIGANMGLRAVDLSMVHPAAKAAARFKPEFRLKAVSLYYKRQSILANISLEAGRGEVIGVVGHNGAGKTTFSRALCGLHTQCAGQFQWAEKAQSYKERLKRSYMVMQDVNYQLFAESVKKECVFGIKNPDMALAEKTMKELSLYPYRDRHPNTLSGGQKQRTAVAVSMICGKDLLVFDEPTSGLDYDSMGQVAALIKSLAAKGKIIFIVSHDYELICKACTRVLNLDEGTLTQDFALTSENENVLQTLFGIEAKGEPPEYAASGGLSNLGEFL